MQAHNLYRDSDKAALGMGALGLVLLLMIALASKLFII